MSTEEDEERRSKQRNCVVYCKNISFYKHTMGNVMNVLILGSFISIAN